MDGGGFAGGDGFRFGVGAVGGVGTGVASSFCCHLLNILCKAD